MVHFARTTKSLCIELAKHIDIKVLGQKSTFRYFLENPVYTNQKIPSNLYLAKIWCILLEQQSQSAWICFICSTELKSSFPFDAYLPSCVPGITLIIKSLEQRNKYLYIYRNIVLFISHMVCTTGSYRLRIKV